MHVSFTDEALTLFGCLILKAFYTCGEVPFLRGPSQARDDVREGARDDTLGLFIEITVILMFRQRTEAI